MSGNVRVEHVEKDLSEDLGWDDGHGEADERGLVSWDLKRLLKDVGRKKKSFALSTPDLCCSSFREFRYR
jgi:hypothetical protein